MTLLKMRGGSTSAWLGSGVGFESQPVEHLGVYKMKRKDADKIVTGGRIASKERLERLSYSYLG